MKTATTGIIEHNGKILIAKRKKKDREWEFPGGKIDEGETPEACLVREIKEELDIDVRIKHNMGLIIGEYRDKLMEVYGFVLSYVAGELKSNVHKKVKWIDPSEVEEYDFIEEDILVWRRYQHVCHYKRGYSSLRRIKAHT